MSGESEKGLTRSALFLMILACCLLLANLYYAQPVLADIARDLGISATLAGVVITMSQFGYIAGLLLLAPLGDFVENRKMCAAMTAGAACSALISCLTGSAPIFLCAVFLMGLFASATQTLVVFAVSLAGSRKSGNILGIMACGIFLGIAASRPCSSFLASLWGWRAVYAISGIALLGTALALYSFLPPVSAERKKFKYLPILRSMAGLLTYPGLLRRTLISCGTFFSFIMFWSAMPLHLARDMGYAQSCITLFTFSGLVTPPWMLLTGRLLDKGYSQKIMLFSLCAVLSGWLIITQNPQFLGFFILAALLLDPSSSAVTVSIQQKILNNAPVNIRGRLNSLNISLNFLGGAAGGALGPWLLARYGLGAVALTGASVIFALLIFSIIVKKQG